MADSLNHRIQKFSASGGFLAKWGSQGTGDAQFQSLGGIAVGSLGNVFVVDLGNHRIQMFTPSGSFLAKWGSEGTGDGQFNVPLGIAVDSLGDVYVADTYNHRIKKFAPPPIKPPITTTRATARPPIQASTVRPTSTPRPTLITAAVATPAPVSSPTPTPIPPTPIPTTPVGATAVSAGGSHTCALTKSGGVRCWGANSIGQLGDGTTVARAMSVDVIGLTSGVVGVSAGLYHTCAMTTAGGIKCWGLNFHGQLGDGTKEDSAFPRDVTGLSKGVIAVSAGARHTCAVTTEGGVKCWGYNSVGQIGNGPQTGMGYAMPVDVFGLTSGVAAVSAGGWHTCALTAAGGVKCWGANSYGQIGDGTTKTRTTPIDVVGLTSGVAAVSAGGYHTCALTTEGGVKCWGWNLSGQLGGTTPRGTWTGTLVNVAGLATGVAAVFAGTDHMCALTTTGSIRCWGANAIGQLGDGTTTDRTTPVDVFGLTRGVASVSTRGAGASCTKSGGWKCSPNHTCAVTAAGTVKCWGLNYFGQLGDGTTTDRAAPVDVVGFTSE